MKLNLHVVASGASRGKDFENLKSDPLFRKATRNMLMGYSALEPLLNHDLRGLSDTALVLGSSYGELEVTKDFLSAFASQGLARPILFQNSLHNATLGFLALKIGLRGPSVTVSNRYFTGEDTLEVAALLLDSEVSFCIAAAVDTRVAELEPAMVQNYPSQIQLDEGAGALLLASEKTVKRHNLRSLAVIESVELFRDHDSKVGAQNLIGPFYDSNALEKITECIASENIPRELKLVKPDHSFSIVRFTK